MDLKTAEIETPLGPMKAIADDKALYLLEFVDYFRLEKEIEHLRERTQSTICPGDTFPIRSIANELDLYFSNKLQTFTTPLIILGTSFQQCVWQALLKIPYGQTISYASLAHVIEKPTACRAVAQANGANQFAIIIPCHRVINADGGLGGYGGGLARKKWLIHHENPYMEKNTKGKSFA